MAIPDPTYNEELLLLTLEDVKKLLGITDTASDDTLTAALPVVTQLMETYCRRGLAYSAEVVEDFTAQQRLPLFRYPVDALVAMEVDGVDEPTLPDVEKWRGYVRLGYSGDQMIRVQYSGGYPQDNVPADLALAYARCCADFAGVQYASSGSTGSGAPLKSLSLGSGALAVSFDTASAQSQSYDTSAVPPLLQPYYYTLERYRMKDYV